MNNYNTLERFILDFMILNKINIGPHGPEFIWYLAK